MQPYDMLTEEELRKMDLYRHIYVPRDSEVFENYCSMDYLLREWNSQKRHLFRLFGNQLILKKQISYEKTLKEKVEDMRDMLLGDVYGSNEHCATEFLQEFRKKVANTLDSVSKEYFSVIQLIGPQTLATNIYDGPTVTIDGVRISNGTKAVKVLSKLAHKWGFDESFEEFRICHSCVLNDSVIKGTLCLSIHPFDYWTMSDNSNDWDSCMAWGGTEDYSYGGYRQGTVECMNSPATLVTYIEDSKNFYFAFNSDDYWNSKKWRQLITFDEKCIFAIKGYPFQNDELTTIVIDWLRDLAITNLGENYLPTIEYSESIEWQGKTLQFHLSTGKMYYDQWNKMQYHLVSLNANLNLEDYYRSDVICYIDESGESECMVCGELTDVFSNECQLACDECTYHKCSVCGTFYGDEELVPLKNDRYICHRCLHNGEAYECSICGKLYLSYDEDVFEVYEALPVDDNNVVLVGFVIANCCCPECVTDYGATIADTSIGPVGLAFTDELDYNYEPNTIKILQ